MAAAALPIAVGGMVLSVKLIQLVAGPGYEAGAPVLAILIWAPAILFMYIPVNSLVISQLTRKAVMITGVNVVINIAGNLLLIPHFGIKAAAFMTVVSESLQAIFYFHFVYANITPFNLVPAFVKPFACSVLMGLVLWQIRNGNLFLSLAVGTSVYGLGLIISGFFSKEDIGFVKGLLRKEQTQ